MPTVKATTFAYPADVQAYKDALARHLSPSKAAALGDSGVGLWQDDTTSTTQAMCALPREVWEQRWGKGDVARGKKVTVTYNGKTAIGELRDTMPRQANIHNGAGIDLNPGFCIALEIKAEGSYEPVDWDWA